jgi:hypothetical protein
MIAGILLNPTAEMVERYGAEATVPDWAAGLCAVSAGAAGSTWW